MWWSSDSQLPCMIDPLLDILYGSTHFRWKRRISSALYVYLLITILNSFYRVGGISFFSRRAEAPSDLWWIVLEGGGEDVRGVCWFGLVWVKGKAVFFCGWGRGVAGMTIIWRVFRVVLRVGVGGWGSEGIEGMAKCGWVALAMIRRLRMRLKFDLAVDGVSSLRVVLDIWCYGVLILHSYGFQEVIYWDRGMRMRIRCCETDGLSDSWRDLVILVVGDRW